MEKNEGKKSGPKDRNYVNKSEKYEVRHVSSRKSLERKRLNFLVESTGKEIL